MEHIFHTVTSEEDGATVRHILKAVLHFSSHAISRLVRTENGITVNGAHARTVDVLHSGDILCVESGDHRPPKILPTPGDWPLPIVYEDGHLLVVNKPAGMTAHTSNFIPDTPTVAGALAFQRGPEFIFHVVNRLDKGTTGLMVVAKSGYIHDRLRRMLHTDHFIREYRALCIGRPEPTQGIVNAPIGRDESSTVARMVRPDGQEAMSHYEVLSQHGDLTFLKLLPQTGRTHQLRVHMAYLGHPLAGDWLYGTEDLDLIGRPALHSYALTFVHPVTGETLHFTAPIPEDMQRLLQDC
ncbi:MAG: RluA family pseudouridine synthase [Oscillibacter sp.]|nr:RluA family pseudouridine synthase [Oscillibacter sp.]